MGIPVSEWWKAFAMGGSLPKTETKPGGFALKRKMIMNLQTKQTILSKLATLALGATMLAVTTLATDQRAPETPVTIQVPEGNRVSFHAYAEGVQIYVCTQHPTDPTKFVWTFKAPEAVLFDYEGNVVGIHFGGPTWESPSGSLVVGAVDARITVDPSAIQWLLLRRVNSDGPGIFNGVSFIHRVNTVGGLAPATATADDLGKELRVPYAADYFFYRSDN
jgi:hypothetical protein